MLPNLAALRLHSGSQQRREAPTAEFYGYVRDDRDRGRDTRKNDNCGDDEDEDGECCGITLMEIEEDNGRVGVQKKPDGTIVYVPEREDVTFRVNKGHGYDWYEAKELAKSVRRDLQNGKWPENCKNRQPMWPSDVRQLLLVYNDPIDRVVMTKTMPPQEDPVKTEQLRRLYDELMDMLNRPEYTVPMNKATDETKIRKIVTLAMKQLVEEMGQVTGDARQVLQESYAGEPSNDEFEEDDEVESAESPNVWLLIKSEPSSSPEEGSDLLILFDFDIGETHDAHRTMLNYFLSRAGVAIAHETNLPDYISVKGDVKTLADLGEQPRELARRAFKEVLKNWNQNVESTEPQRLNLQEKMLQAGGLVLRDALKGKFDLQIPTVQLSIDVSFHKVECGYYFKHVPLEYHNDLIQSMVPFVAGSRQIQHEPPLRELYADFYDLFKMYFEETMFGTQNVSLDPWSGNEQVSRTPEGNSLRLEYMYTALHLW